MHKWLFFSPQKLLHFSCFYIILLSFQCKVFSNRLRLKIVLKVILLKDLKKNLPQYALLHLDFFFLFPFTKTVET